MSQNSNILFGPEDDSQIPKESIGKCIYEYLKKRDPKTVVAIHATTKETLTCGQLLEDSIKLTSVFKDLSILKDDVITIISENTINYFIPILAAFYMGITVNLLNPDYSVGELKHAVLICKPKLILCSKNALGKILDLKKELKFIETVVLFNSTSENSFGVDNMEQLIKLSTINTASFRPQVFNYSEQNALLLLSSGTTGLPKGVLLTHENLRASMINAIHSDYININSKQRTIMHIPYFHVYGMTLQTAGIITSMVSVVMGKFKPELYLQCIEEHSITTLITVPPVINFFGKSPLMDKYDTSSVREIFCGGAPIGEELIKKAAQRLGNVTVRQGYGLTETCGAIIVQSPDNMKMCSVGVLVPGAAAKVYDLESNKNLGPLETGEICLKGCMVMKAYLGDTIKNYIDSEGFYHTGDLGYYDTDKHFYIVGRLKELIKYKGFQVPPAELEMLILTCPGIADCGVIGIPDEKAGEVPLAFVVRKKEVHLTEIDVIDFVAERISIQKQLHGGVKFVEEIPKTSSGKIIRRKLLELYETSF